MKVSLSSTFETRTASYVSKSRRRFNAHKKNLVGQQPSADNRLRLLTPRMLCCPDSCSSAHSYSRRTTLTLTHFIQTVARKKISGTTARKNSSRCIARADTSMVRGKQINALHLAAVQQNLSKPLSNVPVSHSQDTWHVYPRETGGREA